MNWIKHNEDRDLRIKDYWCLLKGTINTLYMIDHRLYNTQGFTYNYDYKAITTEFFHQTSPADNIQLNEKLQIIKSKLNLLISHCEEDTKVLWIL